MKALLVLALLSAATPALAQVKYSKATIIPPQGHSCQDLYRSRDYGSLFGVLYNPFNDAEVPHAGTGLGSCEASLNKPPEFNRVRPRQ